MALILQHPKAPVKFDLPPLDPANRAYQLSVLRARDAMIQARLDAGCCVECGQPIRDAARGCANMSGDCLTGLLDSRTAGVQ